MKKSDLSYIAGLLDGDGSISANTSNATRRSYVITVQIASNHKRLLEWVKRILGFGFICSSRDKRHPNTIYYKWIARSQKAKRFIKLIAPHLHLKQSHARIALKLQNRIEGYRKPIGTRLPDRELNYRQSLVLKMKRLYDKPHWTERWTYPNPKG